MAKRYSIADARKHLPSLVSEAEAGADVELTRRGEPVAVLLSIHEAERLRRQRRSFTEAYADFRERFALDEVGLDDDFGDALRDRSDGREVDL